MHGAPALLYENAEIWIFSKPAGWWSVPGRPITGVDSISPPCLSAWIETQFKKKIWIVHRLDRGTSGLIVFAKSAEAHQKWCRNFETRTLQKTYRAWVLGKLPLPTVMIKTPIDGKPSRTQVRRLKFCEMPPKLRDALSVPNPTQISEVEITLLTGRQHQARRHLSELGHPVLGDLRYGLVFGNRFKAFCHALHAWRLAWTPDQHIEAPLPLQWDQIDEYLLP